MASPLPLMEMPVEVLHKVLAHCHPREVSMFSQASRAAYDLIYPSNDQYLWRQLYLNYPFDHPEIAEQVRLEQKVIFSLEPRPTIDYSKRLAGLVKAERAASIDPPPTIAEARDALNTFLSLARELPVYTDTYCLSHNVEWLETTLEDSPLLTQPLSTSNPNDDHEDTETEGLRAQLRCYLRSSFRDTEVVLSKPKEKYFLNKRNTSRCFVYDLRNYTSDTRWGPFTPDNRVNWVHVEHLMNVVWMNLCEYALRSLLRPKIGASAVRPHSATGNYLTDDWAGVEGVWRRYVCFMDYRDLFSYNLLHADNEGPLDEHFFSEPSFREATRLLEVKLKIVDSSILAGLNFQLPKFAQENRRRPPIFFKGASRGPEGTESVIKGCVYEEEDGSIRWRFVRESIYDSSPQWSSSGVQIGDIGSSIGVIGVWTTTVHDEGDPVGPFWLFKNDEHTEVPVMDYT